MNRKHQFSYFSGFLAISVLSLVIIALLLIRSRGVPNQVENAVLGKTSDTLSSPAVTTNQTHFGEVMRPVSTKSVPVPTQVLPRVTQYDIALIDAPRELTEGDTATFTWYVNGPSKTIHTTTIYYGTTSAPGAFGDYITPEDAHYMYELKDFLQGNYGIPLRFIGSTNFPTPGTYFYRAYALIDGRHYWSQERTFVVKQIPKHEIKVIDRPSIMSTGGNAAFTWEIYGHPATTGFTTIVGGTQSKPGALDATVDIPKTPYVVLVRDFTSGTYAIPLRFIGNTKISEPGVYYFRALAYINGKNIWSDEYSFTVK